MKQFILPIIFALIATHAIASEDEKSTAIDDTVLTLLKKASFNGSVVVARGDNILAQHSIGLADAETKQTLNNKSAFALGSVTKEFNAVAIMLLHEKGLLNINHTLYEYFPELPAWSTQIKIKNLLNYTSGLPRVNFRKILSKDDLNAQVNDISVLEFEPGKGYLYSNHNIFLQIKLIELLTKQTYPAFLQEHVFLPLNMHHSYLNNHPPQQVVKSFSQTGVNDPDIPFPISAIVHSTAIGMHAWLRGLHTKKLISYQSLQLLFESFDANSQSPLGDGITKQQQKSYHFHHGSHFNFESIIFYDVETNISIVLLTNNKAGNLHALFLQISALIK
jgi:CubicO group peptidase (beta-lactamase class C family)